MTLLVLLLTALLASAIAGLFLARSELDVAAFMTLFLVALFGINARWVFPGGGAIATPAMLIAIAAAWWWWMAKYNPRLGIDRGLNPVRLVLLSYLWFVTLSWGLARLRPLTDLEVNGSNREMIMAIGMTGVALLVTDGPRSINRLEALLRRVVVGGTAFSIIGLLQFVFVDLVALVTFPGLVRNNDAVQAIALRSGLSRAEGTALHSIEFGVVLALILPLALHFARHSADPRTRKWYAFMSAVIAAGIPLSISRSGLLAVAVALVVLSLGWTWRERIIGVFTAAAAMIGVGIVVPGLIGTFRALILGAAEDNSIIARLERIPLVEARFSQAPWFGQGIGTFSPDEDFLLDNEYFGTLLDMGFVGLVVVLAVFGVSILACHQVIRRAHGDKSARQLAHAVMAGIVVMPVAMATFDSFFYRILMGLTFVLVGSAGALWRFEVREARQPRTHRAAERAVVMQVNRPADRGSRLAPTSGRGEGLHESAGSAISDEEPIGSTRAPVPRPRQIVEGQDFEPEVLVVVVTYNSASLVPSFFAALPKALEGIASARVVVVDNASADGTPETVEASAPWATLRQSGHNAGYAAGINIALREFTASRGVLVLNPDAILAAGCVSALAVASQRNGVGLAVPRIVDAHGNLKFSLRREPTLLRAIGETFLGGHRAARSERLGDMIRDHSYYVDGATADWATGAAIFMRREALDDIGFWDESYFLYGEESEYCLRARDAGWQLRWVADAVVRHPGGEMSSSPWLWSILAVNRVRLYRSRHGRIASVAYWLTVFANESVRGLMGRKTNRAAAVALIRGRPDLRERAG